MSTVKKEYRQPYGGMLSRHEGTEKLYILEARRDMAFKAAAEELGKLLGYPATDFYTHTLPEAVFSLLDSWDRRAVRAACEAWLERNRDQDQ